MDPATGEIVAATEIDQLVERLERIDQQLSDLRAERQQITETLIAASTGARQTERVGGAVRAVLIRRAPPIWPQGVLRGLLETHATYAHRYVVPSAYRVQIRPWRQLDTTETDDAGLRHVRDTLRTQQQPGRVSVSVVPNG